MILKNKKMQELFSNLCAKGVEELKSIYDSQRRAESLTDGQLVSYIGDGVNINAENVADVAARIREKMKENQ